MNGQRYFRIYFLGQPLKQWDDWFDVPIQQEPSGQNYILTGQVQDLAAFLGILSRFQLFNLNPISIEYSIEPNEPGQDQPYRASTNSTD